VTLPAACSGSDSTDVAADPVEAVRSQVAAWPGESDEDLPLAFSPDLIFTAVGLTGGICRGRDKLGRCGASRRPRSSLSRKRGPCRNTTVATKRAHGGSGIYSDVMSDNLRTYVKALYGFDAVVGRAPADSWANQSPCEEWTAADVVAHNVGMNTMVTGFTQGVNARGPGQERPDDPAGAWRESFDGLLAALDHPGALQTVAKTPWGEMPVDKFLGFAWVDPLIHTWDLAKATGQEPALDGPLTERGAKQLERAGDSLRGPGRFGAAAEAGDNAPVADIFIALSGRDPHS